MSNPASTTDVAARWQPLTPEQEVLASAYLDDAWALLKSKIKDKSGTDLDADAAADPDLFANVVRVESQMVLRVLKNPDGVRSTTLSIDDASRTWVRDSSDATGGLFVTDEELESLSPGDTTEAFTIRQVAQPFYGPSPDYPCWSPINPYGAPVC